jgi:putative oxidoreductase
MRNKIIHTGNYSLMIIRLTAGLVFLAEGIQKFLFPEILGSGRFESLGIHPSVFWSTFTGGFEIICSVMIIFGFFTRLAVLPLIIIMCVAFITTKWPTLMGKGFWPMLHDGRTDFSMTMLLIFLLIYGSGNRSSDMTRYERQKDQP